MQRLGAPVVPVAIRYRDPALAWCDAETFLPHYLRTAGRPRVEVTLTFGAPMSPRTGEAPEDMAARARNHDRRGTLDKDEVPRNRCRTPRSTYLRHGQIPFFRLPVSA